MNGSAAVTCSQDPDSYRIVANRLVENHTFALGPAHNPLSTAARPPLYPLLLAGVRYFGDNISSSFAYGTLHVALAAGTFVAVWQLGRLWSVGYWPGLLAVVLLLFDPILLQYSAQLMTETLTAFLSAWTLVALTLFGTDRSIRWAVVAGACSGLGILCRPEFLAWTGLVIVLFPFIAVKDRRWRRLAVYVAAAAIVVSPWVIRNARQFRFADCHDDCTAALPCCLPTIRASMNTCAARRGGQLGTGDRSTSTTKNYAGLIRNHPSGLATYG